MLFAIPGRVVDRPESHHISSFGKDRPPRSRVSYFCFRNNALFYEMRSLPSCLTPNLEGWVADFCLDPTL